MDNLTDSDEVDAAVPVDADLASVSLSDIDRRLAMQHNRWWLKQSGSHSNWNRAGRWTRRSIRKCQILVWKRIGPFYQRHEMLLMTLLLVASLGVAAYLIWQQKSQATESTNPPTAEDIAAASVWWPAILTAVMLYWWFKCSRFVSLPFRKKAEGNYRRPAELTDLPLPVSLFVIMFFNAGIIGVICASITHFEFALAASFLATWLTLRFIRASTIWLVRIAPERRFYVGQPFFDLPSTIRLAIAGVALASTLILCSPLFIQWSGIAFSPLTWMWTLISQLAQNQTTTRQSILFLMVLIGFEVAGRAVSTKLTWQARRKIFSRYRGAEISPRSSITDEETPSRETLETFFQHKLTETTLPSWKRGVIDTILPREIRRDWSLWIAVGVISLLYGVMILSSWSLVSQSENASSSLQVLKLVSFTFGSTLVGGIEMLSLYRWLCTYSFTVSQQPLSTFGIWKQVQQKGTERLIPQMLACLPVMAVLVWATKDVYHRRAMAVGSAGRSDWAAYDAGWTADRGPIRKIV